MRLVRGTGRIVLLMLALLLTPRMLLAQQPESPSDSPAPPELDTPPKQKPQPLTKRQKRNLKSATGFADRVVQRLHETMDFEKVYDEMFVPDAVWRLRITGKRDFGLNDLGEELAQGCDDANLRSFFTANANLAWAIFAYYYATQDLTNEHPPELSARLYPPEVVNLVLSTRFLAPLARDDTSLPQLNTRGELLDCMKEVRQVTDAILRALPARAFESDVYKANVKNLLQHDADKPVVGRDTDHYYALDQECETYLVSRDIFRFTIVNDRGDWRVLTFAVEAD